MQVERWETHMRRLLLISAALAAAAALAGGFASSAGAYGGGASHDTWQVGLSFNCNNPSFCGNDLGGFWGWVEFDRAADGTITGDAEFAGCGHSVGGDGPGGGAGHADIDFTSVQIGPSQPGDPNYPDGQVFYVDHNVVTTTGHGPPVTVTDDDDFLGDTGIPVEAGHYSFHAPGVAFVLQVAYRPAG
jgi:hypothetical protein